MAEGCGHAKPNLASAGWELHRLGCRRHAGRGSRKQAWPDGLPEAGLVVIRLEQTRC